MFRHCVMFTWADDASDDAKATIRARLDQLAEMPCVAAYHHGPDAGINAGNWDYVIVGDFNSVDDYHAYATDANHLQLIAEVIRPNISGRAAVQYEV